MDPEETTGEDRLRRQIEALGAEVAEQVAAAKRARPAITAWWEDLPHDEFVRRLIEQMTNDQAQTIKQWRTTHTWRAVAAECHEEFMSTWGIGWAMPAHQHVGALICEAAARRLNEDPGGEAWNG